MKPNDHLRQMLWQAIREAQNDQDWHLIIRYTRGNKSENETIKAS